MNETTTQNLGAVADLEAYQSRLTGPAWLGDLRSDALKKFGEVGWPSMSEEEWRRSNLSPFEFDAYELFPASSGDEVTASPSPADAAAALSGRLDELDEIAVEGERAGLISYANGSPVGFYLDEQVAAKGVRFGRLADVVADPELDELARTTLTRSLAEADNRLIFWHFAMLGEITVLYVPANVAVEQPFEAIHAYEGDELVHAPHALVVLGRGAEASMISRLHAAQDGEVLLVDGSEFVVEEGARLRYLNLQRLNEESVYFCNDRGNVGRDGHVHRTEAALGSDFVKTRYISELTGAGADAVLNGIYFATDEQHMDLRTVQQHRAPHTTSRAFYRGAVRDESHAIYQGLIQVDHAAAGTDAYLTNKNLILSEEARADSIPSLNISTDDVRCSHGSTTGRLDADQIFYLRSRGYSKVEARQMLVEGYFEDLIVQTPKVVHDELRELIMGRIAEDE